MRRLLLLFICLFLLQGAVIAEDEEGNYHLRLDLLLKRCEKLLSESHVKQAFVVTQKAMHLARKYNDPPGQLRAILCFSTIYSLEGNAKALIQNNITGLEIARKLKDISAKAQLNLDLGNAHLSMADYSRAVEYYILALRLFQSTENNQGIASTLTNMSVAYGELGNEEKSLEYLQRALDISRKHNDKKGIASLLTKLAQHKRKSGNLAEARKHLQEALALLNELSADTLFHKGFAMLEMAHLEYDSGNYSRARLHLKNVQKLVMDHGFDSVLFMSLVLEARVLAQQQRFDRAHLLIQEAEFLGQNRNFKRQTNELYKLRAEIHEQEGRYDLALQNLKTYITKTLTAAKNENRTQAQALQASFEAQEKQNEIRLLKQQQQLQALQLKEQASTQGLMQAGIVIIGSAAFLLLMLARSNQKAKHIIAEKNRALSEAMKEVESLAKRDPLTQLLNRRGMLELIDYEIERQKRIGAPLAIVLADIDHFKQLNDRYGHECGDQALKHVAAHLQNSIRSQDSLARWGGEEFLIMLPNASERQARIIIERIRNSLNKKHFDCDNQQIQLTMTFGVTTYQPGERVEQCVARADQALYRGKNQGRNTTVIADLPSTQASSSNKPQQA